MEIDLHRLQAQFKSSQEDFSTNLNEYNVVAEKLAHVEQTS